MARDIAGIHGRELKAINQAINMNRKRFMDGMDVIDIKGAEAAVNLIDSGIFTQNGSIKLT